MSAGEKEGEDGHGSVYLVLSSTVLHLVLMMVMMMMANIRGTLTSVISHCGQLYIHCLFFNVLF